MAKNVGDGLENHASSLEDDDDDIINQQFKIILLGKVLFSVFFPLFYCTVLSIYLSINVYC